MTRTTPRSSTGRGDGPVRLVLFAVLGAGLLWFERTHALRTRREPVVRHTARNLVMAGFAAAAAHLVERPLVVPLAALARDRGWGLVHLVPMPSWLRRLATFLLLDYTLYLWHILVHRVPLLWRLHLVHHVDLDMDASTGVRFHLLEIIASVPWRAAQVAAIGASPGALTAWQALTVASVLFHHSNTRLPLALEQRLSRVIVTPRMHGIHHSMVPSDSHTNYSSGLAVWDWLHGTIRLNVPQRAITIGVPAYQDQVDLTLGAVLLLPVTHHRRTWRLPNGNEPRSASSTAPPQRLLP
jgi:sterol desaturase/sphingolipid hydroxylase (fatty acid hydroxylase superfamily)